MSAPSELERSPLQPEKLPISMIGRAEIERIALLIGATITPGNSHHNEFLRLAHHASGTAIVYEEGGSAKLFHLDREYRKSIRSDLTGGSVEIGDDGVTFSEKYENGGNRHILTRDTYSQTPAKQLF